VGGNAHWKPEVGKEPLLLLWSPSEKEDMQEKMQLLKLQSKFQQISVKIQPLS